MIHLTWRVIYLSHSNCSRLHIPSLFRAPHNEIPPAARRPKTPITMPSTPDTPPWYSNRGQLQTVFNLDGEPCHSPIHVVQVIHAALTLCRCIFASETAGKITMYALSQAYEPLASYNNMPALAIGWTSFQPSDLMIYHFNRFLQSGPLVAIHFNSQIRSDALVNRSLPLTINVRFSVSRIHIDLILLLTISGPDWYHSW